MTARNTVLLTFDVASSVAPIPSAISWANVDILDKKRFLKEKVNDQYRNFKEINLISGFPHLKQLTTRTKKQHRKPRRLQKGLVFF
jgi:hypothetical protein